MNANILIQNRSDRRSTDKAPFLCSIDDLRLRISFPSRARVLARSRSLLWHSVYDGSGRTKSRVIFEDPSVSILFPLDTQVWIESAGSKWSVEIPSTVDPKASPIRARPKRYWFASLLIHLVGFGTLTGFREFHEFWLKHEKAQFQGQTRLVELEMSSGDTSGQAYVPFSGVSYSAFRARKAEEKKVSAAEAALASLQGLNFGSSAAAGHSAAPAARDSRSALQQQLAMAQQNAVREDKPAAPIDAAKFKGRLDGSTPPTGSGKVLTRQDQMSIREKFRALQDEFKKIYSRTLSVDPTLSVTVRFSVAVAPNGYFSLSAFDARGTYTDEGLSRLRSGIASMLQSTKVDPSYAGTVIRGENVFVR